MRGSGKKEKKILNNKIIGVFPKILNRENLLFEVLRIYSAYFVTLAAINYLMPAMIRVKGLRSFLFVFIILNTLWLSGIDTLYLRQSYQNLPDSVKIQQLKQEALSYINTNVFYSIILIDKLLEMPMDNLSAIQQAEIKKFAAYGYLNSSQKIKGLSLLKKVESAYIELGNATDLAFIYNMFFMYYKQESKDDSVIFYYQKAIDALDHCQEKTNNYYLVLSIINTNIGNFFFFNREEHDKARMHFDTALYYAKQNNDFMRMAASYSNIGMVFRVEKKYDEARKNYEKAYQMSLDLGNKIYTGKILVNLGNLYDEMGNRIKGREYKIKAYNIFKEIGNPNLLFKSKRLIAVSYLDDNEFLVAKKYLLELISDTSLVPLNEQMNLFINLTSLYKHLNNTDSALYYHEVYSKLLSREEKLKNYKATQELIINHKTEQTLKENQLLTLKYKAQQKRHYYLILLAVVLFSIIVLMVFLINQRKKLQLSRRKEMRVENDLLKEKLEFKNKELTLNTMNLIRHSEFVNSLVPELKEMYQKATLENKKLITKVVQKINMHNKMELWDDFYSAFTEVNTSFFKNLDKLYPSLSVKERKLCALLKLEMNTKDIASITNTSTRGVETARHRLRKKLNLSTEDNLCVFLRNIG